MTTIKGARMMTTIVTRTRRALVNGDVSENEKDNKKWRLKSTRMRRIITVRAEMTRMRRTRTRMTVVKRLEPVSS